MGFFSKLFGSEEEGAESTDSSEQPDEARPANETAATPFEQVEGEVPRARVETPRAAVAPSREPAPHPNPASAGAVTRSEASEDSEQEASEARSVESSAPGKTTLPGGFLRAPAQRPPPSSEARGNKAAPVRVRANAPANQGADAKESTHLPEQAPTRALSTRIRARSQERAVATRTAPASEANTTQAPVPGPSFGQLAAPHTDTLRQFAWELWVGEAHVDWLRLLSGLVREWGEAARQEPDTLRTLLGQLQQALERAAPATGRIPAARMTQLNGLWNNLAKEKPEFFALPPRWVAAIDRIGELLVAELPPTAQARLLVEKKWRAAFSHRGDPRELARELDVPEATARWLLDSVARFRDASASRTPSERRTLLLEELMAQSAEYQQTTGEFERAAKDENRVEQRRLRRLRRKQGNAIERSLLELHETEQAKRFQRSGGSVRAELLVTMRNGTADAAIESNQESRAEMSPRTLPGMGNQMPRERGAIEEQAKKPEGLGRADLRGLDLSEIDLRNAEMTRAELEGTQLTGARLDGANLAKASLREANLTNASLQGANLSKADLDGANLSGADLRDADLSRADLSGVNLEGANLEGARLRYASLDSASLTFATLTRANFAHADLTEADLSGVNARGARFERCQLSRTKLEEGEFQEAHFAEATLERVEARLANFEQTIWTEAELHEVDCTQANLRGADLRRTIFQACRLHAADCTGALVFGAELRDTTLDDVVAEWVNLGREQPERATRERWQTLLRGEETTDTARQRYFGVGDVLRNAELVFGENARVDVEGRLERCTIQLADTASLRIGESGFLDECQVRGGTVEIHGCFLENGRVGLLGPNTVVVTKSGAVRATVKQPPENTRFGFEAGCQLRLTIENPNYS